MFKLIFASYLVLGVSLWILIIAAEGTSKHPREPKVLGILSLAMLIPSAGLQMLALRTVIAMVFVGKFTEVWLASPLQFVFMLLEVIIWTSIAVVILIYGILSSKGKELS
jgi:hypothetical protein